MRKKLRQYKILWIFIMIYGCYSSASSHITRVLANPSSSSLILLSPKSSFSTTLISSSLTSSSSLSSETENNNKNNENHGNDKKNSATADITEPEISIEPVAEIIELTRSNSGIINNKNNNNDNKYSNSYSIDSISNINNSNNKNKNNNNNNNNSYNNNTNDDNNYNNHNTTNTNNNSNRNSNSNNNRNNNNGINGHEIADHAKYTSQYNGEPIELGICQVYNGTTCEKFLSNHSVFIPPNLTMTELEERLRAAWVVIKESKDMNPNCRIYALPSLCYSTLPICRTPDRTNHLYFANRANYEDQKKQFTQKRQKKNRFEKNTSNIRNGESNNNNQDNNNKIHANHYSTSPSYNNNNNDNNNGNSNIKKVSEFERNKRFLERLKERRLYLKKKPPTLYDEIFSSEISNEYPPTRNSENLKRICRDECELLENELCQKEYAIAKRHPTIGQKLPLEDCYRLPNDIDCSSFGIAIDVDPDEKCYWENGSGYRGTVAVSVSGKPCLKWSWLMKEIADYPELAGQNYCRNPGNHEDRPWCFVGDKSFEKLIEHCEIPKCAEQMWLYIIISLVALMGFILTIVIIICYKKSKKPPMANIQNVNSSFEMTRLFGNSNHHHNNQNNPVNGQQNTNRGANSLRVPQYTLQDVEFVEELGEGAFGKVYKGQLTQTNSEKIFVAVKALKENASSKTQQDFKREIELISDLKHDNIVCILGVVLNKEPLCMLFEYMSHGDLHEFLIANSPNENKSLTQLQFLYIALQISEGMEYLSGHHYVHRDLAARNCLVGDNLTVKISDFGLSRDIYSSDYYRVQSKSLLPVRWMPSESILYGKFTTESDVWSFGVVLWEIYSYGLQPYYGYSNQEVINMVRARQLLPCPEACPTAVYSLMIECWHEQAVRRPSFSEISHRLKIWYQTQKKQQSSSQLHQNFHASNSTLRSTN
ncbi:tyrosine-protein kinase transmembrane receptor Ror isoform X2 [Condylostylus longicornis]|uniref:tyrosine-protein kinase transmembrane receptor Ror isoform X2 n=1 Tax=Condylostylus longicornis TaxID=2530218 RepID=UPI00244DE42A|nr:tyrosine-protein kinase transmembrane receptor Ror isoform X2 [Condylostylus longicornis]